MFESLRVGTLFNIPIYINPSWFLVLGLVTWSDAQWLVYQFPQLEMWAWALGLVTALLLFASVLAHELGHSLIALRQGTEVKSITLFIFGGLASLGDEAKTPGESFRVAIAGPLVSFSLFGILNAIGYFSPISGPLAAMLALLASVNLALGIFNLIPGLPLDGGNVLKALVWKITGKPYRGLAFASRVGQVFGWIGVSLGLASVLGLSNIGSVWTLLVGWFLLQNAGQSAQAANVQKLMSNLTAADAVVPNSPLVKASESLRELANNHIIGNPVQWKKYLVTDDEGKLTGEITVEAMNKVPTNDWWDITVQNLLQPPSVATIAAATPLLEVINHLEEANSTLGVVQEDGTLLGLLEKSSVIQRLQQESVAEAQS
ncbi:MULTISPECIES: site-2 protease family protein [unclassified Leptolyngbya]|uniref:site-2 protease family protein n=1 Tax=unclassified Leptolyngbya TaxID=2650499 RepID=UPI001683483B|nr:MULTISPECIES: site-2 protease family protein [unclassified Leptolyngbya]MBD1911243.1 site-2 protease family protein [Leptolyngbya sp. FACHB-8]MBD2155490.1 site-2 protease family protein [Leptolyngbya sp. FACHB-16]